MEGPLMEGLVMEGASDGGDQWWKGPVMEGSVMEGASDGGCRW